MRSSRHMGFTLGAVMAAAMAGAAPATYDGQSIRVSNKAKTFPDSAERMATAEAKRARKNAKRLRYARDGLGKGEGR